MYREISYSNSRITSFSENFNDASDLNLNNRGWFVKSPEHAWWPKHGDMPGSLTLFTLRGDNWSLGSNSAGIKNLLMRKIRYDCFTVEAHIEDFVPVKNWQQAGILISEDSSFTGKMVRISI